MADALVPVALLSKRYPSLEKRKKKLSIYFRSRNRFLLWSETLLCKLLDYRRLSVPLSLSALSLFAVVLYSVLAETICQLVCFFQNFLFVFSKHLFASNDI
jgi:hypothetical protein